MEPPRVLLSTALLRLVAGMVVIACLFFVPAGTLSYWEAWIYMGILFGSTLLIGGYLFLKDPELLAKAKKLRIEVALGKGAELQAVAKGTMDQPADVIEQIKRLFVQ